jgi:integrase
LVIDISYKGPDGTALRYRRDAEVQTRAGADAELRRRLAALAATGDPCAILDANGRPVPAASKQSNDASEMTFPVLAEQYFAVYAPSQLRHSTIVSYEEVTRTHLRPRLGTIPVSKIDGARVRALDAELAMAGQSEGRRRKIVTVLRSMLCRYAVEAKIIPESPALPKLHKKKRTIVSALTRDEIASVVNAAPKHRLPLACAIYTGLRPCELRALLWRDVDLTANHIVVREGVVKGVRDKTKTGHHRKIPLVRELRELLQAEHQRRQPKASDSVILSGQGRPLGEQTLRKAFKRAARRAKLDPRWRFYDCRHFFITELFRLGVGAPTAQKLAGHANLATTENYAHVARLELDDAIARLDRVRLDKAGNPVVTDDKRK